MKETKENKRAMNQKEGEKLTPKYILWHHFCTKS